MLELALLVLLHHNLQHSHGSTYESVARHEDQKDHHQGGLFEVFQEEFPLGSPTARAAYEKHVIFLIGVM